MLTTLGLQWTLIEECKLLVTILGSTVDGPKVMLHDLRCLEFGFIRVLEDFDILNRFCSLLSFPNLQSLCMVFEK